MGRRAIDWCRRLVVAELFARPTGLPAIARSVEADSEVVQDDLSMVSAYRDSRLGTWTGRHCTFQDPETNRETAGRRLPKLGRGRRIGATAENQERDNRPGGEALQIADEVGVPLTDRALPAGGQYDGRKSYTAGVIEEY